jgi:hypothetical protein
MMAGGQPPLLLDLYPNAAAAYSLRKLRTAYSGNAIRVRRSSDNAEQNIGFDINGNLDTASLTAFCSGTNGFVTTWYDQSGNSRQVSQGTAINQPQIVVNGTILTDNGKPSMNFDGSNDIFIRNENISSNIYMSTFTVGKLDSLTARLPFWDLSRIGNNNYMFETNTYLTSGQRFGLYTNTSIDSSKSTTLTPILSSIIANTSINGNVIQNTDYFINGINEALTLKFGTGTYPSYASSTEYSIGGATYGVFDGRIQEFVYYQLNQSSNRIGIESDINLHYNIF